VEKVAQQAGKAAPAVAIAGVLVAAPTASQAFAASAPSAAVTAQSHPTAAAGNAASTGAHAQKASLDSFETRTVSVTAATPARHAAVAQSTHYSVRSGDTLSKIANAFYHDADDWQYLFHENAKTVPDPNLIYTGERLFIPATVPANFALTDYVPKHAKVAQPAASTVSETSHATTSHSSATASAGGTADGGSAVVQSAPAALGMYSCSALEQIWEQAGGNAASAFMAAEIAMAESSGNPGAISPTDDFGLWQINGSNGALATLNPFQNAKSAITLSDNGANWGPWSTFHSGAYYGKC
jgi:LysM repeat protein